MKKFTKSLLLIAILAFSVVGAKAEIIKLGAYAGTNISNYSADGYDIDNKSGYQVGLQASIAIPFVSVTPELVYSRYNFTMSSQDVKVDAIDMPIMVGLSVFPFITVEAGPRFSLYNKGKMGDESMDRLSPSAGYAIGAKFTLLNKVFVGARYNGEFSDYEGMNSGSYSLSAGIKF